jgi:hypothetical protein
MRAAYLERRTAFTRRLHGWLEELAGRGLIASTDCETAATLLFAMLDGIGREAIAAREPLEEARIRVAVDLVERAVFGT